MPIRNHASLSGDERRWLLAQAGSGALLPVRLILTPAFGYEIFRCFAPELFLPVWAITMAAACLLILLAERLAGYSALSAAVCRRRFILCAAAGCALSLAVVTVLSAVPFYAESAASRRAAAFFLAAACALEVFCHFADRLCHLLAPSGAQRLMRRQNLVKGAGCLVSVGLGLLLWLPGADLAARYALLFTLAALIRILSATPLACFSGGCIPSPPFSMPPKNACALLVSALCLLTGVGTGTAGALAFGFGTIVLPDTFEVVRVLGIALLFSLPGRIPGLWLRRRGSLFRCAVLCGIFCAAFFCAALWPGQISCFALFALTGLLSAPLYRLERGLMIRVCGLRFAVQGPALTRRLFIAGQFVGLAGTAGLCLPFGPRSGLYFIGAACAAGSALSVLLALQARAARLPANP